MLPCQKDQFSLPTDRHYLNCAYMSPLSRRVVAAGVEGVGRKAMPTDIVPEDFFSGPNRARALFARLIRSPMENRVAIVPAVSYGMGIVARNVAVGPKQNVVTLQDQFPSDVYVWRRVCSERGATLKVVSPPDGSAQRGAAWNEALLAAIDANTAIVVVPTVHWTDGTVFAVEDIGRRAREVGAAFVIDGTQSIGARPFDVSSIEADAVLCAAYKWLGGPYSIGAAYFGPRFDAGAPLEESWMGRVGSEDFKGLVDYEDRYRPGAVRYDVGEASNFALMPMFIAALEQLAEWGVEQIDGYCGRLTGDLIDEVGRAGFGVTEKAFRSNHLFGFRLPPGADLPSLQSRLADRNVHVSLRGSAVRVSPHLYNDGSDIDALRDALLGGGP